MIDDKIVWRFLHTFHQTTGTLNDAFSIAPGQCSRKERTDLDVFLTRKPMRDLNRVVNDEAGVVVLRYLFIQEGF